MLDFIANPLTYAIIILISVLMVFIYACVYKEISIRNFEKF